VGARNYTELGVIQLANWQLDDDDDDTGTQPPAKDPVRAQLKALEKANKELTDKLNAAETKSRSATVKDVLRDKSMNPKLAGLIPASVEATPEAIEAWVTEYGDLFVKPGTPAPTEGTGAPPTTPEPLDQDYVDMVNAMARMAQAGAGATAPSSKPDEVMKKILDPALTEEELRKMITDAGGGYGLS
jgi:hypothetical protein